MNAREGVPGPAAAVTALVALVAAFWAAGAYAPSEIPSDASSPREIPGTALIRPSC
ncbi:MAG TPA: hypothetical protein VKB65_03085 [Myxococcota bacterium]|nr:hypothetical protein [Myxococcota bacterium]